MTAITVERVLGNGTMILRRTPARGSNSVTEHIFLSRVLRVPLLGKVLGANLLLVLAAAMSHFAFPSASTALQLGLVLTTSFAVTAALVWLALRPIAQLESTADRVSDGDFEARVPASPLADRNIAKLSKTLNKLLDRVQADRTRIEYLAGRSVRARDLEREAVARELRDSLAQMVAGLALQISVIRTESSDPGIDAKLEGASLLVQQLSDEMRDVADTLYPGTLTEFGLSNGLGALARRVARRSGLSIEVNADMFSGSVPSAIASALYRVADEALRNVEQHANASHVKLTLRANGAVVLDIEDDGRGMDMRTRDPLQAGLGLFSAKTVLAVLGGDLQISSGPGRGTRVVARVPLPASSKDHS